MTARAAPLQRLRTAPVCDALDQLGLSGHVLRAGIRPLVPDWSAAGSAFPIWLRASPTPGAPTLETVFDAIARGCVAVIVADGVEAATWGEFLSRHAYARGAAGVVSTGLVRDAAELRRLALPVFAAGTSPLRPDGRVHVAAFDEPVATDGAEVNPGDLVVADDDGVVIVPRRLQTKVVERALVVLGVESAMRERTLEN
jgi:4-hydroxy-4-methyl-2-oxoglutarate aldolase